MNWRREVLECLLRLEKNQERLSRELARMVEERSGRAEEPQRSRQDKWLQDGIDSILAFQAGTGRKED